MGSAVDPLTVASLRAWTPVRLRGGAGEPLLDWAVLDEPFTAPFFEQTAHRAMQHPFNAAFTRTMPLAAVDELAAALPPLEPAGFVFHMSRCGSTLISQMLSRLSETLVLSEPQPLDGLLRLRRIGGWDDASAVRRFRGLLQMLCRPLREERRSFVKFQAWHVLELPLIAQAFPATPWIFAFREPRAVLRSQWKVAGSEIVPGALDPRSAGIEPAALPAVPQHEYGARVLAAFCEAALAHAPRGRALFVDYATLPDADFTGVLPFLGVAPTVDETARMHEVATIDAKWGGAFVPATAPNASAEIESLAAQWLDPAYARLQRLAGG